MVAKFGGVLCVEDDYSCIPQGGFMVFAIVPAQKEEVLWVAPEREPFMTPTILKASVIGTEGELLKLDRVTKPVDRSQVFAFSESKHGDVIKAQNDFGDALEELERLISRCECIAKYPNKSFVDSWAIATKFQPNHVRVELAPWETPVIRVGKITAHSSEEVKLVGVKNKKFRCGDLERVFILRDWSDWGAIENQIELCKKMGQQFKSALEQKLTQNVLDETKPALTVISGGKIEEVAKPVKVEVVESRPFSKEEQEFYSLLDSGTRNWLIDEIEPQYKKLQQEEKHYREIEAEFRRNATEVARRRGEILLAVEKRLSKIKVDPNNKYSKKNLAHVWIEVCYKEEMRCGSIKSAKQLALNDKKLARDPDFARLPRDIADKFDLTGAVKLVTKGNEHAKYRAIALAQDPEVKHISHSLASEMIAEQPRRQTEEKTKLPKINKSKKLNPPPIAEASEEEYPYEAIRSGSDEEIKDLIDSLIHQKVVEALEDEGRRVHWEEVAKREAEEAIAEKLEKYSESIAELAKVKTQNIQLQQKNEELEDKLAQVNEAKLVKENEDLKRIVNEYANASLVKKEVAVKYHAIEQSAKELFNKGDQLNTFRKLLAALKAAEEELLILKGANAVVENSSQLKPDGDVLIAETLPERLAIGS